MNFHCDRQIRGRIEHFVGRYALDIEYLGEKNIDRFVSLGLLADVADLMRARASMHAARADRQMPIARSRSLTQIATNRKTT